MTTNSANTANTAIAKEAVETNGAQSQQTGPPTLQLDNVSYAYTKGGKRVLKNISHDFQAGKVHRQYLQNSLRKKFLNWIYL